MSRGKSGDSALGVQFRSRNWCFTVNNYTPDDVDRIKSAKAKYIIFGFEVAPSTGTPHLQGFIMFASGKTRSSVGRVLPRAHLEVCRGTPEQNIEYCSKGSNFCEIGERPCGRGKRTDLEMVRDEIKAGKSVSDIIETARSYQAIKCAELVLKYREKKRDFQTQVWWLWGPSGCGKSRAAYEKFPNSYTTMRDLRFWEGYDGHEVVIIDDMDASVKKEDLRRICDRYEYRVNNKGASRQFLARIVVITCRKQISDLFDGDVKDLERKIIQVDMTPRPYLSIPLLENFRNLEI